MLTFITTFLKVLLSFPSHTHTCAHTYTHTHSFCLRRRSLALLSASWSARPWGGSSLWPPRGAAVESAWASRSRHSSAILWDGEGVERRSDRCGEGQRGRRKRKIWKKNERRANNAWITGTKKRLEEKLTNDRYLNFYILYRTVGVVSYNVIMFILLWVQVQYHYSVNTPLWLKMICSSTKMNVKWFFSVCNFLSVVSVTFSLTLQKHKIWFLCGYMI